MAVVVAQLMAAALAAAYAVPTMVVVAVNVVNRKFK